MNRRHPSRVKRSAGTLKPGTEPSNTQALMDNAIADDWPALQQRVFAAVPRARHGRA
jgi:hypothetical protein